MTVWYKSNLNDLREFKVWRIERQFDSIRVLAKRSLDGVTFEGRIPEAAIAASQEVAMAREILSRRLKARQLKAKQKVSREQLCWIVLTFLVLSTPDHDLEALPDIRVENRTI